MNNLKSVIILEPGGRKRPGLYADIPVPVILIPAVEEGRPAGLPNLLKEEEKEEDEGEKNEDHDDKEQMEGKRRDEEDMQDSLVVEGGHNGQILLGLFGNFSPFRAALASRFFP